VPEPQHTEPGGATIYDTIASNAQFPFRPRSTNVAFTFPIQLLGLFAQGDVAGYTIYTDRHMRKVVYPKAPPLQPPTALQLKFRQRWSDAAAYWRALTKPQQQAYSAVCMRLSLMHTGPSLWTTLYCRQDAGLLQTLIQQSGIGLVAPPPIANP
jgi:hypothetical protein